MSALVTIDGNLTADPDCRVRSAGTSWADLRVDSHECPARVSELLLEMGASGRVLPFANNSAFVATRAHGSQVNPGAAANANVTILRLGGRTQ